jgi:hypothetical protein
VIAIVSKKYEADRALYEQAKAGWRARPLRVERLDLYGVFPAQCRFHDENLFLPVNPGRR